MSVAEINILIQHDWINRKTSSSEIEKLQETSKLRKRWRRDYKRWLQKKIPSKEFWELRPNAWA